MSGSLHFLETSIKVKFVHVIALCACPLFRPFFYKTWHITFTIHLFDLTFISGSEGYGGEVTAEKSAKPGTTVWKCVSAFVNVNRWIIRRTISSGMCGDKKQIGMTFFLGTKTGNLRQNMIKCAEMFIANFYSGNKVVVLGWFVFFGRRRGLRLCTHFTTSTDNSPDMIKYDKTLKAPSITTEEKNNNNNKKPTKNNNIIKCNWIASCKCCYSIFITLFNTFVLYLGTVNLCQCMVI